VAAVPDRFVGAVGFAVVLEPHPNIPIVAPTSRVGVREALLDALEAKNNDLSETFLMTRTSHKASQTATMEKEIS